MHVVTRCRCLVSLQYQEEIDALNQVARHRPRSSLVLGIQQENRQIRDLQQENRGRSRTESIMEGRERRTARFARSSWWGILFSQFIKLCCMYQCLNGCLLVKLWTWGSNWGDGESGWELDHPSYDERQGRQGPLEQLTLSNIKVPRTVN